MSFIFTDKFDEINDYGLTLKISQKYSGDDELVPFYYYDIIKNSVAVGKISIRTGCNFHSYYNGHIGYEIFPPYRGNGIAYQACLMVLQVARFHEMKFIHLVCDENNIPSYKTIEKLNAELLEICEAPREYFAWRPDMERQRIYRLIL